jgi:hypothetical protein
MRERRCARVTSDRSGVTPIRGAGDVVSIVRLGSLPQPFRLCVLAFLGHASTLRIAGRTRRSARSFGNERGSNSASETRLRDLSIAELGSFVVHDDPDDRTKMCEENFSLRPGHGFGVLEVPRQLNSRGCLVRVLTAGSTGRAESLGELCVRNDEGGLHGDGHVVECTNCTPDCPDMISVRGSRDAERCRVAGATRSAERRMRQSRGGPGAIARYQ